jgi:hypothetical protein
MPSQLVVAMAVVTLAAAVLSSPPGGADGDNKDEDDAAKDETDTKLRASRTETQEETLATALIYHAAQRAVIGIVQRSI